MSKAIIQLGRYGDICNILPIAHHWSKQEKQPVTMYVHREFADLLEACSYVSSLSREETPDMVESVREELNSLHVPNVVTQVYSNNQIGDLKQTNYEATQWALAGCLKHLHDWPLVFDNRPSKQDEHTIIAPFLEAAKGKPILLVCLSANSSPFPDQRKLMNYLKRNHGGSYHIIDIGAVKFKKIYHVLPLLEAAKFLLTVDTVMVHLAQATHTPTIALMPDNVWMASTQRAHWVARLGYRESLTTGGMSKISRVLMGLKQSNPTAPTQDASATQINVMGGTPHRGELLVGTTWVNRPKDERFHNAQQAFLASLGKFNLSPVFVTGPDSSRPLLNTILHECRRLVRPGGWIGWSNGDCAWAKDPRNYLRDRSAIYSFHRTETSSKDYCEGLDAQFMSVELWDDLVSKDQPELFFGSHAVDWWLVDVGRKIGKDYRVKDHALIHPSHPQTETGATGGALKNRLLLRNHLHYLRWAKRHNVVLNWERSVNGLSNNIGVIENLYGVAKTEELKNAFQSGTRSRWYESGVPIQAGD